MRIRRATAADLEVLVRGNIAIARETEQTTLDPELVRPGVELVLRDESRGIYFVAETSEVVGQLLITREWSDWRCGFYWWIQSVYVAPSARRTGVYRALHEHVVAAAREACVLALKLYVDRDNHVARATYAALGMGHSDYDLYEAELNERLD
jgi:GNAT superfamily N-acetyltransferase